ncbi:MAG: outer membrane protein OmpA-like peptidoglycan-associated protein [Bradymonadia bacterium]|jgi:outer membrane protein OmpA-like peptidoglycan-associated protein
MSRAWLKGIAAIAAFGIGQAGAQDIQNFKPAVGTWNILSVETAETAEVGLFVPSLYVNYGANPLVRRDANDDVATEIVSDLLTFNIMGVIGIHDRIELGLDVPLNQVSGSDLQATLGGEEGFALGDVRAIPKFRLLGGKRGETVGIAISVPTSFPTGDKERGVGEGQIVVNPKLVLDFRFGGVTIALNGGFRLRPENEPIGDSDLILGNEITYGGGVSAELGSKDVLLLAEAFGAAPASTLDGDPAAAPLEALLGLRFWAGGLAITPGGGVGIIPDYGSPDFRVLLGLAWHDRAEPAPPPKDTDGDGLMDADDQCPLEPEDKDGFEDAEGCPDPDNDKDTILDVNDKCPMDPEDIDTFEDADGCPDPDNDKDLILDVNDKCPLDPEDKDGFEDEDGCPDPDNDKDGILDVDDQCPLQPEVFNGVKDTDGCPDTGGRIQVTCKEISFDGKVFFDTDKAIIKKKSFGLLDELVDLLKGASFITKVRVEGHTDDRGSDVYNTDLSDRRARSVLEYITGKGIASDRLVSKGFGEAQPLKSNKSRTGRAENRRVAFVILENTNCKDGVEVKEPAKKKTIKERAAEAAQKREAASAPAPAPAPAAPASK